MSGGWEEKSKGCAFGCGVLVFGTVLLAVAGTLSTIRPFRHALADRTTLEQQYGSQNAYTPLPDGAVAGDRLQVFLTVRRALEPVCGQFEETATALRQLEAMDERDDVSRVAAVRQAWKVTGRMMGMGSRIGRLLQVRNRALVESSMGLGEYSYIYVVAYHEQLVHSAADTILFEDRPVNVRIGAALRAMLRRQLSGLEASGGPAAAVDALQAEILELERDPDRLPWHDGLPAPIEDSVRPFRDQLDAMFCPPIAELELRQNTRRGLATEIE